MRLSNKLNSFFLDNQFHNVGKKSRILTYTRVIWVLEQRKEKSTSIRLKYQTCDITNYKTKHGLLKTTKNKIKIYLQPLPWKSYFVLVLPSSHSLSLCIHTHTHTWFHCIYLFRYSVFGRKKKKVIICVRLQ